MRLHVECHGSGSPLVMLHGWGMHGGIWSGVVPQLARDLRVHCVDLPGHGYSKGEGRGAVGGDIAFTLDAIVDELAAQFDGHLAVCGWSLGGQVALRWAQLHPAQIEKLVLVASTPCFVQRAGWTCAMAPETLQAFADAMTQDYRATLKRFLALQVRGSENERDLLLRLRDQLLSRGEPDVAALHEGLTILRDTDLRMQLAQIEQAALVMAGVRDTLTPPAASAYMVQTLPNARLVGIAGAAHAPFMSHPDIFVKHLTDFLHE